VVAGSGKLGAMPPQVEDRPGPDLPLGKLRGEDLRQVRFAATMRGYDMAQVDEVLDRMAEQLDDHPAPVDGSLPTEDLTDEADISSSVNIAEQGAEFIPHPTGLGWPAAASRWGITD
jgi:DivIVA domain-containing protein